MEVYQINGGIKLDGKVKIESAKNSVLPILACSILTCDEMIIIDCPKIKDVLSMIKILNHIGVKTKFIDNNLIIDSSTLNSCVIPEELTCELRSSVFMLGALIGRLNKVEIAYPGGCNIGLRPIDLHINSLRRLGVEIVENNCVIYGKTNEIVNTKIFMPYLSVGATENTILASVLGSGRTTIYNSAKEPEVKDLCNCLIKMGAKIYGAGSETIYIEGVKRLHGTEYKPISDRIEAGTYLIAGAITDGNVEICNVDAKNIFPLLNKLCDNACKIDVNNDIIHISRSLIKRGFTIETAPYPAFPTDLQSQIMALACVSNGTSFIEENVFKDRFCHVKELKKMGADISVCDNKALINGVSNLVGAEVVANDLRGGAGLVLAGLNASGTTIVKNIHHISRGYLNFDKKLRDLGADIKTIEKDINEK